MSLFLFSGFSFPQDYCLKTDKWCHLFKSYLCFGALFPGFFRQTQIRIFTSTVLICVFLLFSSKFFVQTQINDITGSILICVFRFFSPKFLAKTQINDIADSIPICVLRIFSKISRQTQMTILLYSLTHIC